MEYVDNYSHKIVRVTGDKYISTLDLRLPLRLATRGDSLMPRLRTRQVFSEEYM